MQQPDQFDRVRESFGRQAFMRTIGATIERVEAGAVEIRMPVRTDLTQQHGFVHGAVVAAIGDSACGYSAFTLMPPDAGVLSIEFKVNLLAPAKGELLIARARVVRAGRTISVCQADVVAVTDGVEKGIALVVATIMTIRDRVDVVD
jgi:uncharacterized protein (TIGR00369 family)